MLVPANEGKKIIQNVEKRRGKIRDLIRYKTKKSDDYDEKYMKIIFD